VLAHVFGPCHLELLAFGLISAFYNKLATENIGKFGAIAVPTSNHFLLFVIVVAASQQMPKYELWHIDFVLFMDFHRYALPIVYHAHEAFFLVDLNLKQIHLPVSLKVVSSID